ncbi:MAG: hydroxymethylglutaryl-CoA reductase, degradative [Planctomycetota bacterium]|nr:MAG: hydroxymethylglutaryl-CoA reductase, degradative [Planctomycetota bacterium]
MERSSRFKGFHKLSMEARLERVVQWAKLDSVERDILAKHFGFTLETADRMIENALGIFPFGLGIAPNFRINGRDYLIPMCIEEPSVIAAASNAARYLRFEQGIRSKAQPPRMIGQIQLFGISNPDRFKRQILLQKQELLQVANNLPSRLIQLGGGAKDIEVRDFSHASPPFLVLHILVDTKDAMGANAVNSICENLAPYLEQKFQIKAGLKILSNLCTHRLVRASGKIPLHWLHENPRKAEKIAHAVELASRFAEEDPYRAVTHNKGIMNGIDALLIALGQDWRAVEAAAHAHASQKGKYTALATWRLQKNKGFLEGNIEIPLPVGTVGGITGVHPTVKVNQKILNVSSAQELAQIAAAVGLAQNLAAIFALSTEGIQRGHMQLHSRNIAASIGAQGPEIDKVAQLMVAQGTIHLQGAQEILSHLRKKQNGTHLRQRS